MAVRVVHDVPRTGGSTGVLRGVSVVLGSLFVLIGVAGATIATVYLLFAGGSLLLTSELAGNSVDLRNGLISFAAAVVGLAVGPRLIRGRRRLGLYLRKFGYSDATRAVTSALSSAVGRRLRLVTLDDAVVTPVGVGRARRRIAAIVSIASLVYVPLVIVLSITKVLKRILESVLGDNLEAVYLPLALSLVLALGTALFAGGVWLVAVRAGRFATRTIDSEPAIGSTARATSRLSRRIFSPRLVVVHVVDRLWRQAVRELAAVADVVIIDVSHPTEHLLWEVDQMKQLGHAGVLVGAYEHVARLADPSLVAGDDRLVQLARLLDGQEVLAYGHTPADHHRFVRALRNRLHQAGARPARPVPQPAAVH